MTNENAPAVAEICVRLDGLPLAIELAAARIRILTPQAMLSRLENRLGLLAGGSRDLPERQQTLRGAIAWSHDMLDEADEALFACLSVFVGGAGLEADRARLCRRRRSGDVLDALASLVEKSLVRQSEGIDGEPRFAMLETIREFAMEQRIARGRSDELRERHAELFADAGRGLGRQVMASDKGATLDRLEQDHDNLRAAHGLGDRADAAETAMRLGSALWRFWQMRGYLRRASSGSSRRWRCRTAATIPSCAPMRSTPRPASPTGSATAITLASSTSRRSRRAGRWTTGAGWRRRSTASRSPGRSAACSRTTTPQRARHTSTRRARSSGRSATMPASGAASGRWRTWPGAPDVSRTRCDTADEALAVFEAIDDRFMIGWVEYTLGLAALSEDAVERGTPEHRAEARRWLLQALEIFAEAQDVSGYTLVLDALALLALRNGDRERAARLSAAVANLERTSGTGLNQWNRDVLGFVPGELKADPALAERVGGRRGDDGRRGRRLRPRRGRTRPARRGRGAGRRRARR